MNARNTRVLVALGGAAVVVTAALVYLYQVVWAPLPEGLIQVNGRIEGDTVSVAGKYPGRVEAIRVEEGDAVEAGQVLVELDDAEVKSRVKQAEAAVAALEAQLESARTGLELLREQLPLTVEAAKANVERTQAMVASAEAAVSQLEKDLGRLRRLERQGTVESSRVEQLALRYDSAVNNLQSARSALNAARSQYRQAEVNTGQVAVREAQVEAMGHQLEQARAGLEQARLALADMTIESPARGTVIARMVEPGELANRGTPLLELVNLDNLYLKAYVPEILIGKVKRGLQARIHTDAYPDQAFPAEVRYIASQAEFTPREVQTQSARTKLVYAVKLYVTENPQGRLTPGLPADAVIRWREDVAWEPPQW